MILFRALKPLVVIILSFFVFSGCASLDPTADLRVELEEIRNLPGAPLKPPPEFRSYTNAIYDATLERSPFLPPVKIEIVEDKPKPVGKEVMPDFNRPPEPLEMFSLDALIMVGTINHADDELHALIKDNKGTIRTVTEGSYMGRNHGKVLKIGEAQIELIEIISDGRTGWIERPRSLVLDDE